jgi:hypothetical protein
MDDEQNENEVEHVRNLIPDRVWQEVADKPVVHAGWGGGPSWIFRETTDFDPPVDIDGALQWLSQYRSQWRRCHLLFQDKTVLWLDHDSFYAYHEDDSALRESGVHPESLPAGKQIMPDEDENGHRW